MHVHAIVRRHACMAACAQQRKPHMQEYRDMLHAWPHGLSKEGSRHNQICGDLSHTITKHEPMITDLTDPK